MALGLAALFEVLLVITALQKVAVPAPVTRALRQVGLRIPPAIIRLAAAAEAVAGIGALASGRRVFTAAVAVSYAVFAAYIGVALHRKGGVSDCGCFAGAETPPTAAHLAFDIAAAGVAIAVTVWPQAGLFRALGHQPWAGVPLLGMVALGCWLSWILLALAPRTAAAAGAAGTASRR